jgi:hypothetical protein
MTYLFFREGHFYPVEGIKNDAEVLVHVGMNPGTQKVEDIKGRVVWDIKRDPVPPNPRAGH